MQEDRDAYVNEEVREMQENDEMFPDTKWGRRRGVKDWGLAVMAAGQREVASVGACSHRSFS